ncbi:MAG TPA: MmcQ/YjbR family DNA-binding protein [Acidimicrobiales bacterium]|jgi:predicted DNA-binding protein (MmcQ/YjbR family)|nr:MmcQ/YjbR family DNA-binding protein [Acidimicrobiales bacterium]
MSTPAEPKSIAHLRRICLGFPEATEQPFGGHTAPSFRVRDKLFLIVGEDREYATCKAPPGVQQMLVASDPERFFVPKYVGSKGWVGIQLGGDPDWAEIAEIAEESYRLIAPKRLAAQLD